MRNWVIFAAALSLAATSMTASSAGKDPFKKSKNYKFMGNVSWYKKNSTVIKAGSAKESGDTYFYHLSINNKQLRLHLGKNDPSGELKNTRQLDFMTIHDVAVDGRTLPRFDWCLGNQDGSGNSLKLNARVAGKTCINAGDDFIIKLDDKTLKQLMSAKTLEFKIAPFGDTVNLTYGMAGFSSLMRQVNKPRVAKKSVKAKPVATARTCYARPPAEYKSSVKSLAYPCDNAAKKAAASKSVNQMVAKKRQQKQAALAKKKQKTQVKKQSEIRTEEELEFEKKQAKMWINRCQTHWNKGVSPCYCQKYIKFAPAGVKDTCH